MTKSQFQNVPTTQSWQERLSLKANLEPIRSFRITLDASREINRNYSEIYRYNDTISRFTSLNPTTAGNVKVSYLTYKTAFVGDNDDNTNPTFEEFEANRAIILDRVRDEYPDLGEGRFTENSQSVLLPAFIAAYSGESAEDVDLDPSPKIPLPNWRIDYSGLSRVKPFNKIFTSLTISHSYKSTYTIGSFQSALIYGEEYINPRTGIYNNIYDDVSRNQDLTLDTVQGGQYLAPLVIQGVSVNESFSPLFGVSIRTKSRMNFRLDYNKIRNLTLDLTNLQVTELQSNDVVFSFGWSKRNLVVPFFKKIDGTAITLKNEVNFKVDVSVRDTKTTQRTIDGQNVVTAGNLNFQLKPNINYQISKRLDGQLFFERTINDPRISNSFRRNTTAVGIRLRFSLN